MTVAPPVGWHPLYWALRHFCGASDRRLRDRCGATSGDLVHLRTGRSVGADLLRRMASELRVWLDRDALRDVSDRRDAPEVEREYRRAAVALANALHDEYRVSRHRPLGGESVLADDLIRAIGRGRPATDVVGSLRAVYRASSVRRCADRIGVRVVAEPGRAGLWWLPPPASPAAQFPAPAPTAMPGPTRRVREIQDAVAVQLARAGGSSDAREVWRALERRGWTRASVYRAARGMRIDRVTSGFGPAKRTVWSLPEVAAASPPGAPAPGDPVDFR